MTNQQQQLSIGRSSYYVLTGGLAVLFLFPLAWSVLASVSPAANTGQLHARKAKPAQVNG